MPSKIVLSVNENTSVSKSSHPGHKEELEIRSDNYQLRLSFSSEKALDNFYESVGDFYKNTKEFYKNRKRSVEIILPSEKKVEKKWIGWFRGFANY